MVRGLPRPRICEPSPRGSPNVPPTCDITFFLFSELVSILGHRRYLVELLPQGQGRLLTNTLVRSFLGMNKPEHYIEPERLVRYVQVEPNPPLTDV